MPPKRSLSEAHIEEIDDDVDIKPITKMLEVTSSPLVSEDESLKDIKPFIATSPMKSKFQSNKKAKPNSSTPSPKKKNITPKVEYTHGHPSAKARFAEIIIENGIKGYDKTFVENETGLTKNQQKEMLKTGRGSLWKALYGFASTL
ncbi:uncharacterized protein L201_000687 [Kwoniella dendrophila CBS 6074]|uniref:Uncharacterized protein n=1 Tax=Kwoniella dendrophila CBS 6074 TaxID=1295534 RepID=A0AAX4JMS1_9TREE